MRRWIVGLGFVFLALLLSLQISSCGDDGTGPSDKPEVTGCSSVRYDGYTWNIQCDPGVASFTVEISTGGRSACFHITCSNGCVSSATVCSP